MNKKNLSNRLCLSSSLSLLLLLLLIFSLQIPFKTQCEWDAEKDVQKAHVIKNKEVSLHLGRRLQSTQQKTTVNQPTKINIYMILLFIGISLLVIGGIICCIVLGVRYYYGNRVVHADDEGITGGHRNSNNQADNSGAKGNLLLDVDMVSPAVAYGVFVKEIGQAKHQNCVICLEGFDQDVLVSLTVCGHLIHYKCLKQWVYRQPNCPLCRQQFTDQNLTQWQQKLNLDFNSLHSIFKSLQSSSSLPSIKQPTSLLSRKNHSKQNFQGFSSIRDSIQLQWLKQYNNRVVVNVYRNKKYNIETVLKKIMDEYQKKNQNSTIREKRQKYQPAKPKLVTIFNGSHSRKFSSPSQPFDQAQHSQDHNETQCPHLRPCCPSSLPQPVASLSPLELYALCVYASIMDYHDSMALKRQKQYNDIEDKKNQDHQLIIENNADNRIQNNEANANQTLKQDSKQTGKRIIKTGSFQVKLERQRRLQVQGQISSLIQQQMNPCLLNPRTVNDSNQLSFDSSVFGSHTESKNPSSYNDNPDEDDSM